MAIFKNFSSPQNGGHFEFLPKMEKHKFASISLTVRDTAISSTFATHRVSNQCTLGNFQKKISLPKNGSHFEFLPKMEKHKFASVSLTMRDRAISLKFSIHRVCQETTFCNFQKKFPLPQKRRPF